MVLLIKEICAACSIVLDENKGESERPEEKHQLKAFASTTLTIFTPCYDPSLFSLVFSPFFLDVLSTGCAKQSWLFSLPSTIFVCFIRFLFFLCSLSVTNFGIWTFVCLTKPKIFWLLVFDDGFDQMSMKFDPNETELGT